jgi:potassium efflux system protein
VMRRSGYVRVWRKALWMLGISLFLIVEIWLSPVTAQVPAQAAVVLDGQPVFQISRSEQFTAQERADLINLQLREVVQSDQPIQIRTEQRNNQPTILLNDRHLLTVTQLDVVPPSSATEQADVWAKQLQAVLQNAQTERSPAYFRSAVVQAVGILLVAIALFWGLGWLTQRFSEAVHRRLPTAEGASASESSTGLEVLSKLVLVVARVFLGIVTTLYIANLFPFTRRWSYQITSVLLTTFTAPILTLDRASYSFLDLLILAALLFGLVVFVRILTDFLKLRVLSAAGINRGAQEAIATLIKYTLMILGALILLQIWGLNISSLTILASALGIGIGFGLQDIAKNFVSGLVLVFERPIQVGDRRAPRCPQHRD